MKVGNTAVPRIDVTTSSVNVKTGDSVYRNILQVHQKELGTITNHETPFATFALLTEERDRREREERKSHEKQENIEPEEIKTRLNELSLKAHLPLSNIIKPALPREIYKYFAEQYHVQFSECLQGKAIDDVA
ncbi:hypothetical protein [Niallia taxi]|uniref:hypothetical protein n=1 Tax=Niallia taxi TaxID=2499688 RepID=UPI0015F3AADE|nr:hypothetical protein [Niallia taxi]